MAKLRLLASFFVCAAFLFPAVQDAPTQAKPTEHVLGTITVVDAAAQTVVVKEDSSSVQHTIQLANTRTLLKVPPGATDLKSATRITAADLSAGDRVDVRGFKVESDPNGIAARSVVLMSGRDVQQLHQQEAMAWQHSIAGTVNSIDAAAQKLMITTRTPEGPKPLTVDAAKAQLSRYSPEHPQSPAASQLSDIQVGDQVKIVGEKTSDGTSVQASKIYSGSFRTVAGTINSLAPDGKSLVIKDLTTKQPVTVMLGADSAVRRLPPMMANGLARRFNPDFKGSAPDSSASGNRPSGAPRENPASSQNNTSASPNGASGERSWQRSGAGPGGSSGEPGSGSGGGPGRMRGGNGDLAQMLERIPAIALTDLKLGDAVVVSGSPSNTDKNAVLASHIIAGVEPVFQSASPRQMQSLGDWGNSLGGAESAMGQQP